MSSSSSNSSTKSKSSSHDLFGYLRSLPPSTLRTLYGNEQCGVYACRAILQHLPELARQFVLRLAVCGGTFPRKSVDLWTKNDAQGGGSENSAMKESKMSLIWMERLCVIEPLKRNSEEDEDMLDNDDSNSNSNGNELVVLTPEFNAGIKTSMTSLRSAPWPFVTPMQQASLKAKAAKVGLSTSKHKYPPPPTLMELERYTQRRWDSVLHYLVGSTSEGGEDIEDPPEAVVHFLERTGLMQEDPEWRRGGKAPLVITSRGYEFMLLDVHVQVWQFVLQYLKSLQMKFRNDKKAQEIQSEALLFLICLSYCRVGEAYPADALSKDAKILMKDFSKFGLIYLAHVGGTTLFYPTRVAVNLVAASNDEESPIINNSSGVLSILDGEGDDDGREEVNPPSSASAARALEASLAEPVPSSSHIAIIIQTNFQLCAYTTSQLHVSMLGLFCDVQSFRRLSNVVFYHITRDSVKGAFKLGITAKQILRFLKMHAHPRIRSSNHPLVPSNVEDQIWLWNRERTRVQFEEVYIHQCQNAQEFQAVVTYAQDRGAFSWSDANKLRVFVKYAGAEVVVSFARRWRSRAAQRRARESEGRMRQSAYS